MGTVSASALRDFAGANNTIFEEQVKGSDKGTAAAVDNCVFKLEDANHPSCENPLTPSGFHEALHGVKHVVDF